jgi:peptidoglycan-N-acetylglucosamine deacetylase
MIQRPVPWPNKAKVAVAITFDMDADSLVHVEHSRDSITRVSTISMLKYGPEVAVPRILEGYRRYGLKQTFFVPTWCIEHYPEAVEAMVRDDHEVGFHGYIHEAPNVLSRDEEHYWMRRSIAVIEERTGKRPRGNRSPLYNFSIHTAELLAAEDFLYDSTLMGDDVPYLLSTPQGELVELPVSWATDDCRPTCTRSISTTCSRSCRRSRRWRCSWRSSRPPVRSEERCGLGSGIPSSAAGCRAGCESRR